jgi:DNA-binding response OmpR family regulator
MRLLFAVPEPGSIDLMYSILDSALCLTPLTVSFTEARTLGELRSRVEQRLDDVILLDWDMVQADTPQLVTELLTDNPLLRVVVLLPQSSRQYRKLVWEAGACNGIPKEFMDQEWLSTVLCIMHRAMERESKYLEVEGSAQSACA